MKTEAEVKKEILKNLQGWEYKGREELNKKGEDLILRDIFSEKIRELNKDKEILDEDIDKIIYAFIDSDRTEILRYLKNGIMIKLKDSPHKELIKLIDFDNIASNSFIVSDNVCFKRADKQVFIDLVFFINGIPINLVEIEGTEEGEWLNALNQLYNYSQKIPQLFKIAQIGLIFADNIYYFPIDERIKDKERIKEALIVWKRKKEENINDWNKILKATLNYFLNIEIFLEILKYYTFYNKNKEKFLPRYVQYYAVKKSLEFFKDRLNDKEKQNSRVIWHYQGVGKTYEMLALAYNLLKNKVIKINDPAIFIIVDRIELQKQHFEFFKSFDLDIDVSIKKATLKDIFENVLRKGKRVVKGIYITLIQKFREDEILLKAKGINIDKIKKNKNIFILIDEVHRSHYGTLSKNMMNLFSSANYIAFTGTPKLEKEKNTFRKFGKPLDIYFIKEAEQDGYVLPIYYIAEYDIINFTEKKLRDMRVELKKIIKKVLELGEDPSEDLTDTEGLEKQLKTKISKLKKLVFENDERIKIIAERISKRVNEIRQPFKAILIAGSRLAALKYKKELDKYLDSNTTEIVITYKGSEDLPEIEKYREKLVKKYHNKDSEKINEKIIKDFKERDKPRLLIVVNKLITGFDEKKIQAIFIDRFMTGHTLLQAIGRCNRKFDEANKVNGVVFDFVGIIEVAKKSLDFYYGIAKQKLDFGKIICNIDSILQELKHIIQRLNKEVFNKIFNISVEKIFSDYVKIRNVNKKQELINELAIKIISFKDDKKLIKFFDEFESRIYSQPFLELKEKRRHKYDYFKELLGFLSVLKEQIKLLSEKSKKLEVSDVKRFVSLIEKEILNKIYKATKIEKFIQDEMRLMKYVSENSGIVVSEIIKDYEKNPSPKKIDKLMSILQYSLKNREETEDLLESIMKKYREFNERKISSINLLRKLKEDINKLKTINELEKKEKLDKEAIRIFRILLEIYKDKEKSLKLSKKIREEIRKIEGKRDLNDFCRLLAGEIRKAVLFNLKDLEYEDKKRIIKEINKIFAGKYRECEGHLLE